MFVSSSNKNRSVILEKKKKWNGGNVKHNTVIFIDLNKLSLTLPFNNSTLLVQFISTLTSIFKFNIFFTIWRRSIYFVSYSQMKFHFLFVVEFGVTNMAHFRFFFATLHPLMSPQVSLKFVGFRAILAVISVNF